ncbi:MAG TPA: response regulator [Actinomycetota bacterium]|jgi:signal transduction histidine kinase|nr:response regulator [Actinomycetota bacterium]
MEQALLPRPLDPARPVRVLVVDDNAGFRESLLSLLFAGNLDVVGQAGSGAEALELVESLGPDVVLMDVRMPTMDGIETTRRLKGRFPRVGVVALSSHEDQEIVRGMLVAGASGYVLKDSDGDEILTAVNRAAKGGAMLSPEVTPRVIEELTEALERERRRARELEAAQDALLERSVQRHELVSRLSHELRTPITVILGVAQTLHQVDAPPEQEAELLSRLVSRAQDLARLVERFELAIDAGLTERVDVADVAREVAATDPRVHVRDPDLLPSVHMNRGVARRVLEELVDNALRFSSEDSPVDVTVSHAPAGIEVRVTDHGPGIDEHDHERIFGPLEQLEELNVRLHQGAGMGLTLARTAARAIGGDVTVESSGPAGSTFLWTIAVKA